MNQSIEAVKARDRDNPFAMPFFGDSETYRTAMQTAPLWFRDDSREGLDEIVRREAEMHVPTPDELDRMAAEWAPTDASVYGRVSTAAAAAATSAT